MRKADLEGPGPLLLWPVSQRGIKGRALQLSEPQFPHLSSGEDNSAARSGLL